MKGLAVSMKILMAMVFLVLVAVMVAAMIGGISRNAAATDIEEPEETCTPSNKIPPIIPNEGCEDNEDGLLCFTGPIHENYCGCIINIENNDYCLEGYRCNYVDTKVEKQTCIPV